MKDAGVEPRDVQFFFHGSANPYILNKCITPNLQVADWFGMRGKLFETKLDCGINDITGQQELLMNPDIAMYNDNQLQWYSYLRGILTDETRIDSPYIAMQTAFLSEGVVLSNELGRSVTAEEIKKMAKSIAIRDQETDFGVIHYDFDDYVYEG